MKPQNILFDMDDTLIHCNVYFDLVLEQFTDLLKTWFASYDLSAQAIKDKQYQIDTVGVAYVGFTAEHFPESLVETYRHFSLMTGRKTDEEEMAQLRKLGQSVYEREVEPYPDMAETLQALREDGHTLYLYTGGVEAFQRRKVEMVKLGEFFEDRIFIRQHKNSEALRLILEENAFDRDHTWMVGNSMRTDINPALENGIKAIYVPAIQEWDYNIVELASEPTVSFFTVPALKDVPERIRTYLQEANTGSSVQL